MIARLSGKVIEIEADSLILDVRGVGYRVLVPTTVLGRITADQELTLRTIQVIREDSWFLCGFLSPEEESLFRRLTSVTGVGPKLALAILGGVSVRGFCEAVIREDLSILTRIPGVGKKTAQRLLLEMREGLEEFLGAPAAQVVVALPHGDMAEAAAALEALGYGPEEVRRALADCQGDLDALIRQGLKRLSRL